MKMFQEENVSASSYGMLVGVGLFSDEVMRRVVVVSGSFVMGFVSILCDIEGATEAAPAWEQALGHEGHTHWG